MDYIEKQIHKHRNEFNSKVWILRIISLSIALCAVLYYLDQHHKGKAISFGNQNEEQTSKGRPYMEMKIPVGRTKD